MKQSGTDSLLCHQVKKMDVVLNFISTLGKILFFDSEYEFSQDGKAIKYIDSLICNDDNKKQDIIGIIIFDGICNLCNDFVKFVHKYDDKRMIYVGWVQNKEITHKLLSILNIAPTSIYTKFAFIEYNRCKKTNKLIVHRASTASFNIIKYLSFPINLLYILIFVPIFIRNNFYYIIAKFRYDLFGSTDECQQPSESLKLQFIHKIE